MGKIQKQETEDLQLSALHYQLSRRHHLSEDQKSSLVRLYLDKKMTMTSLCEKYGISRTTIWRWISIFADGKPPRKANSKSVTPKKESPMRTKDAPPQETPEEELARLRAENKRLEEALKMAEWSNHAKDVMIDLAEKTFKIPIRKKSGAKQ